MGMHDNAVTPDTGRVKTTVRRFRDSITKTSDANPRAASPKAAQPPRRGIGVWPLPGLAPMTRVRTSFGDVHAIALREGDKVLTANGEYKPILWLNRIYLDEHILQRKPDSNPISIAPGTFGTRAPGAEILVSPRQVVCRMDGTKLTESREAADLLEFRGVFRYIETSLSYTMFHLGSVEDVYCEGLFLRLPLEG